MKICELSNEKNTLFVVVMSVLSKMIPYVPSEAYDNAVFAIIGDYPRDDDAREG